MVLAAGPEDCHAHGRRHALRMMSVSMLSSCEALRRSTVRVLQAEKVAYGVIVGSLVNINVQDKHLHVFARGISLLHVFQVAVAETQTVCSCGCFESL